MVKFIETLKQSLIVRPAVRWALAPLKGSLGHHRWAGITSRTHSFELATSYVFNKQSDHPGSLRPVNASRRQVFLLPKVRNQFAEFP